MADSLAALDTTHSVSNPRVDLDGDTARLEAIVACQHLPRGDHSRHVLMTNRYDVELVRGGEGWLIQRVTVDNAWTEGDTGPVGEPAQPVERGQLTGEGPVVHHLRDGLSGPAPVRRTRREGPSGGCQPPSPPPIFAMVSA